jgi:hypothetical protein
MVGIKPREREQQQRERGKRDLQKRERDQDERNRAAVILSAAKDPSNHMRPPVAHSGCLVPLTLLFSARFPHYLMARLYLKLSSLPVSVSKTIRSDSP